MKIPRASRSLFAGLAAASTFAAVTIAPGLPARATEKTAATVYLTPAAARSEGEQVITAATMRRYLTFIASDALEGRDTPSAGLDAAAQFIAFNLSRFGLKPMGDDGTYFQKIILQRTRPDLAMSSMTFKGMSLRAGDDFLPNMGGRGAQASSASGGTATDAPLVYAGNGWQIPARKIDAYAGLDVKGKIVVVSGRFLPQGIRFNDLAPGPQGSDANPVSPAEYAAKHGAVGILYLPTGDEAYARSVAGASAQGRGGFSPVDPALSGRRGPAASATAVPSIQVSPDVARRLFEGEKQSGDAVLAASESGESAPGFDLGASKKVSFTAAYKQETTTTQNVVAVVEGGDQTLKNQYIAFGAHYDHIGVSATPDKNGDRIYNGADDDGSGTTALLTLAEAFSHANTRPRRSILFVWHCGEEKGLWGSSFYTEHPTIPLKQVVSQLNIDMIGRSKKPGDSNPLNANLSGPDEVYVIGSSLMSSKLGKVSDQVNADYMKLKFNFRYDDPADPNRFFYRSDHFNYARKGVPIIFYFDGVHEDYHQRGDEVQKIDFMKMEKIVRTVYVTAVTLADLDAPPAVDRKLPFSVE